MGRDRTAVASNGLTRNGYVRCPDSHKTRKHSPYTLEDFKFGIVNTIESKTSACTHDVSAEDGSSADWDPAEDSDPEEKQGVFVEHLGSSIKGTVQYVVADSLGAHGLAGYVESFSGEYFCRFCIASRSEIESPETNTNDFKLRTEDLHRQHVATATAQRVACCGVKSNCVLADRLAFFRVTEGFPPDLAHDLFEGIVPFELAECFKILIGKKYLTFDSLNQLIQSFPYKWSDQTNRPQKLPHTLLSKKTVGGNSHENWCLLRLLPLIIGHLIPEDEEAWQLLLDLKDIVELVVCPVHTDDTIAFLQSRIYDHNHRFKDVFPDKRPLPKHHFVSHYPSLIRLFGPLALLWTIRFESKHTFFKSVARHTNCFRNIALTLANKHQVMMGHYLHLSDGEKTSLQVSHISPVPVEVLKDDIAVCFSQKYPDIAVVNFAQSVTVDGANYKKGMIVAHGSLAGLPLFAEIVQLCVFVGKLVLVVKKRSSWYKEHYRSYHLDPPERELNLLEIGDLLDPYPLYILSSSENGSSPSTSSLRAEPWPAVFPLPTFNYAVDLQLKKANEEFLKSGALFTPPPKMRSDIMQSLASEILRYKPYPSDLEFDDVCKALVGTYPFLRERGSETGYSAWKITLKQKMGNYRSNLRNMGCSELKINSLQGRSEGNAHPNMVKKARRAEVNFCPDYPAGENKESQEEDRVALLTEIQKRNNDEQIKTKMEKTFPLRRQEILQDMPFIADFKSRWPALFSSREIDAEFRRITTTPLTSKFISKLDEYAPKLVKIFKKKGGKHGRKITEIMAVIDERDSIDTRRCCTLKALSVYLNEDPSNLIKEYVAEDFHDAQQQMAKTVIGIYAILHEADDENNDPEEVGVIIEGVTVLRDLRELSIAFPLLFWADVCSQPELPTGSQVHF
ncbi:hypothetical protein WMY93_019305 [Mugilogobius chulae]|uniref:Sterile alpha motif domain-containing 3-like n=1 Tax=Mugilogobius chulae TaxID=88201 RepID=A0AAW0NNN5_9GOBI